MAKQTRSYELSAEVTFELADGVDLAYWVNPETGERQHRMDGIYEDVRSEDELYSHLAYNAVFNAVHDASMLDGWAELERGQLTMSVRGRIE